MVNFYIIDCFENYNSVGKTEGRKAGYCGENQLLTYNRTSILSIPDNMPVLLILDF